MAYKALYRTYRPSTFDEVAGQQHIVKTLQNALKTGKIAHAYLFTGPRGTGKTTMAKLFAKALNCEEGIGEQCNECKNCQAINDGSHPDVLELDAASNNSVDDIRDLIDKVKYGTILGKYKVYIIDEVHMLSASAFNALLKTLEEPPEHVVFILATTEPHKILPTILSRCQRYDFTKVSDEDIKERIKTVLNKENITFNEEAVNLIISLCDGGMRDALSILDQILAYSGNTLNVEDILEIFSLESTEEKINLLSSIFVNNTPDVLERIDKYFSKGTDIKRLTDDLLFILKDILLYQTSNDVHYLQILKEEQVKELSRKIEYENVGKMIDILMQTSKDLKTVTSINPLFSISLLKMVALTNNSQNKIKEKEEPIVMEENDVTVTNSIDTPINEEIKTDVEKEEPSKSSFAPDLKQISSLIIPKNTINGDIFYIDIDTIIKICVTSKKDLKNQAIEKWIQFKKYSMHPLLGKEATLLMDCHPLAFSNKILIVECQTSKEAENINSTNRQENMQILANEILGRQMFVYAVSRSESVDIQAKFRNLMQINKLPKASEINIEFEGE